MNSKLLQVVEKARIAWTKAANASLDFYEYGLRNGQTPADREKARQRTEHTHHRYQKLKNLTGR